MVLPLILGGVQGAISIASAFGQQQQAKAQVDAANKSRIADYKQQLRIRQMNWARTTARYTNQIRDYYDDIYENNLSASKAYASEQRRLNEIFKQARLQTQDRNIQQAEALGSVAASGRSGRSVARLAAMTQAAFGRNAAIQEESLRGAVASTGYRADRIRDSLRIANRNAYRSVQFAPVPGVDPIAPLLQNSPSQIPLITGIAKGVLGGIQTGYQFDDLMNG